MKKALIFLLLAVLLTAGCTNAAPAPTAIATPVSTEEAAPTAAPTEAPTPTPEITPEPTPEPTPDIVAEKIPGYIKARLAAEGGLPGEWDSYTVQVSSDTTKISGAPCREAYVYDGEGEDAKLLYTFAVKEDYSALYIWDSTKSGFYPYGQGAPSVGEEVSDALKEEIVRFAERCITGTGDPLPERWHQYGFTIPAEKREVHERSCYIIYVTDSYEGSTFTVMQLAASSDYSWLYLYDPELGTYDKYPLTDPHSNHGRAAELIGYIEEFLMAKNMLPEEWDDYNYALSGEGVPVLFKSCSIMTVFTNEDGVYKEKMRFAVPDDWSTLFMYDSESGIYKDLDK